MADMEEKKYDEECITISINLKIDGDFHELKNISYRRGRETHAFTLDDFARIVFMYEKMAAPNTTYAMDGILHKAAKKLPTKNGETPESVFEKYWLGLDRTLESEFKDFVLFDDIKDYFKFRLYNMWDSFDKAPEQVKQGFIYWIKSYSDYLEVNVSRDVSNLVDDLVEK